MLLEDCQQVTVANNVVVESNGHGIHAKDVLHCLISGNQISEYGQGVAEEKAAYHGLLLEGNTEGSLIRDNLIVPHEGAASPTRASD